MSSIASTSAAATNLSFMTPYTEEQIAEMEEYNNPDSLAGYSPRSVPKHCRFMHNRYWFDAQLGTDCRESLVKIFSGPQPWYSPYGVPLTEEDKKRWEQITKDVDDPLMRIFQLSHALCYHKSNEQACINALIQAEGVLGNPCVHDLGIENTTIKNVIENLKITYEEKGVELAKILLKIGAAEYDSLTEAMKDSLLSRAKMEKSGAFNRISQAVLDGTGLSYFFNRPPF